MPLRSPQKKLRSGGGGGEKMGKKLVCVGCKGDIADTVRGLVFISNGQVHTRWDSVPFHIQCVAETPSPVGMTPRDTPFRPTGNATQDALWQLGLLSEPEEEISETSDSDSNSTDEFARSGGEARRLEAIKREREAFEQLQRDRQYCEFLLDTLKQCT